MYEFQGEKFVAVHEKQTGLPKKEILKSDKVSSANGKLSFKVFIIVPSFVFTIASCVYP